METDQQICPSCKKFIIEAFYFCPHCGKNLKPAPIFVSVFKQIGVYAISLLIPPLGLWPGIKYLRQSNEKTKIIGVVAIILTVISISVTIWLTIGLINQVDQTVTEQMNINGYDNLEL